jgi:hypothetical protein
MMQVATGFAVVGLLLLLYLFKRLLGSAPFATGLAVMLVLAVPELLVTSLYFNTTALALPFFSGSLIALRAAGSSNRPAWLALGAGALMAIACLFRLDFAACLPFTVLCALRWNRPHWPRVLGPAGAGGIAVTLVFLALQPTFVSSALSILGSYSEGEFPVTMVGRLKIIAVTFGPALIILPLWAHHIWKVQRSAPQRSEAAFPSAAWMLLSLLPTLVPLNNLYSGKYLLPFIVCLLVLLADATGRAFAAAQPQAGLALRGKRLVIGSALLLAVMLVVGVPDFAAFRQKPLLALVNQPWRVGTHDGPRTAGAYLAFANWIRNFEQRQDNVVMFRSLAHVIDSCDRDVNVVMSSLPKYGSNEWSWGFLPLYLEDRGWKMTAYEPARKAQLVHQKSNRKLVIWNHDLMPTTDAAGVFRLDFDTLLPLQGEDFWVKSRRWVEAMQKGPPCMSASPTDR